MDSIVNQLLADYRELPQRQAPAAPAGDLSWSGRRGNWCAPAERPARVAGYVAPGAAHRELFHPDPAPPRAGFDARYSVPERRGRADPDAARLDRAEQTRCGRRTRQSLPVPALTPRPDVPKRNVLFVILESVRADATCIEHDPELPAHRGHATGSSRALSVHADALDGRRARRSRWRCCGRALRPIEDRETLAHLAARSSTTRGRSATTRRSGPART